MRDGIAFTSDGRVVTGSLDGMARVWDTKIDRLIAVAGEVAGHNLTITEWEQYFGTSGESYRKTFENLPEGQQ